MGHYVPNLVARPFELTVEFMDSILEVVPSESVKSLRESYDEVMENPNYVARELLVELLAWQFASPVRWIETQNQIIAMGIEEIIEVGLASSPTLANLAARTLALPEHDGEEITVQNVQRDAKRVLHEDVNTAPVVEEVVEAVTPAETSPTDVAPVAATPATAPAAPVAAPSSGPAADLPFKAGDALKVLLAQQTKVRLDQIVDVDTVETLTNGVSSKRNQILMDMTAEFELSSLDGAAEASAVHGDGDHQAGPPRYKRLRPDSLRGGQRTVAFAHRCGGLQARPHQ